MLTHEEIEQRDLVDDYVAHRLTTEDRLAFEDHFFACDECFDRVQDVERFATGVRDAAKRGRLPALGEVREGFWGNCFRRPALTLATVSVVAAAAGWLALVRVPSLERQLDTERDARRGIESQLTELFDRLVREREARGNLERRVNAPPAVPATPNVPVAILEATRGQAGEDLVVPPDADRVLLWVDVSASVGADPFTMKIYAEGRLIHTIAGLRPNAHGALAASVAATALPPGRYLVGLYNVAGATERLIQEYRLQVRRVG